MKKNRESNVFTEKVTKELISRTIFSIISVSARENLVFLPHCVCGFCRAQCGNYGNLLSHIFGKTFVKVKVLLKKLLSKYLISLTKFLQ